MDLDLVADQDSPFVASARSDPSAVTGTNRFGEHVAVRRAEIPVEIEVAAPGSTGSQLLDLIADDPETISMDGYMVPSLDLLFAVKSSHRFTKDCPHFWKTLRDWHAMRSCGARIRPEFRAWLRARSRQTYGFKPPKLVGVKKSEFFTDTVPYQYDHDSVHRAVALLDQPAYRYYLRDGCEVECDRDKFFSAPEDVRVAGAVEEAAVLAIERSLVPFPNRMSRHGAWLHAFSKVCTSITSGWFRSWCYENAVTVIRRAMAYDFWDAFSRGVDSGQVTGYKSEVQ